MTSKEMEARSGVPRANIRYYESEGLLTPVRAKNGYRDYREEDLAALEKIKLLRRLGVSVEDLKALQSGSKTLNEVLDVRLEELRQERTALDRVEAVCGQLRAENVTFAALDAPGYLRALDEEPQFPALPGTDALPVGGAPIRRLLARLFDEWVYVMAVMLAACLLGRNPALLESLTVQLFVIALFLTVEPLLLHLFGTTPGKVLLGLRLSHADGSHLTFGEGITRLFYMAWHGYALGIPIWSIVQLYRSLNRGFEEEAQPWDTGIAYEAAPFRWRQPAALVLAGLLMTAPLETVNRLSQLPPNRGELTVAEFAENFNRQARYLDMAFPKELDAQGRWAEPETAGNGIVISLFGPDENPPFQYTVENGVLTAVTVAEVQEGVDGITGTPTGQLVAAAAAFAWAREDAPLFGDERAELLRRIEESLLEDYTLRFADVTITYEVESEGLMDTDLWLIVPEENETGRLAYTFTIRAGS